MNDRELRFFDRLVKRKTELVDELTWVDMLLENTPQVCDTIGGEFDVIFRFKTKNHAKVFMEKTKDLYKTTKES